MIRNMTSKGSEIARQLKAVIERCSAAALRRPQHLRGREPRLVAVTKTKPVENIVEAYKAGQRHFGENYVQELVDKGSSEEILQSCGDIKWHFIGHLQRNKVNKVTGVRGLYMVETVESEKLAQALNNAWSKQTDAKPLAVMVQINTSGEENKSGVYPSQAVALAKHIKEECPHLQLTGLMTIGSLESSTSDSVNPDFQCLYECRKAVAEALGLAELDLELSMGMSQDFEHAIEAGSTNVRVGSTIFGERQYPPAGSEKNEAATLSQTGGQAGDSRGSTVDKCSVDHASSQLGNLSLAS